MKPIYIRDIHNNPPSPPVRGRGLKRCLWLCVSCQSASPPVRGRGLKH